MPYPQKVDVKKCAKVEPPHPCDAPRPCNPLKEPDGDCIPPFLCFEKLKNPEQPDHITRCKPGQSIGVRNCVRPPPPHPCDPLPSCDALPKPKKTVCDEPPLCHERIKVPDAKKIKRAKCTDSEGKAREVELVKEDIS